MDRQFVYSGQVPLETDLLSTNRNVLIALGLLTLDIFGNGTVVGGLPCAPTAPASLDVVMGPGRIYSLEAVDETAYSSLAADTVDDIVKQGINLASTTLSCPAPGTAGDSINYLIEAQYQDEDNDDVVLSYYNASNPGSPFSGPGGNNEAQPTVRQGVIGLQVKAGIPAPTGTQATPAADAGWTALYVVTVANGQSAITAGNISVYPGAPFITGALLSEAAADGRYLKLLGGILTGPLTGTSGIFSSLVVNGISVQNASMLVAGQVSVNQLGSGAANAGVFLRGDGTWAQISFSNVGGSIGNGQVPLSAVAQWQASLSIAFPQITGNIAASQVPAIAVTQWEASLQIGWGQITGVKNADELQGFVTSSSALPNTVAVRDGNGYGWFTYINISSGQNENPAVSQVLVTNASDNFVRKTGLANFLEQALLSSAVTIQPDPGGVPANGTPGTILFYY